MATAKMTGTLKDFTYTSMIDYRVRIGFFPSSVGTRGDLIFPTMAKWATPDTSGLFEIYLEVTEHLVPNVWYDIKIEWMDQAGNFVSSDEPEWVLVVPTGGGTVAGNIAKVTPPYIITKGEPGDASPVTIAEAKAAAAQAIIDQQLVRQDDPRLQLVAGTGLLHSFPDASFKETWLGTRDNDGGPTDLGMWHMRNRLGVQKHADDSVLGGFVDAAFRYSELRFNHQGLVPDAVLEAWKARMGDGGGSAGPGLAAGDRYVKTDGSLAPAFPDTKNITIWGSSSAERIGTALNAALSGLGATFHNEGKGGELSQNIAARFGSVPAELTFPGNSIPASGAVVVTSSNMPPDFDLKPFAGIVSGVPGELTSSATEVTFTRLGTGAVTPSPAGSLFIPDVGDASRQHVTILWTGKNNLTGAGSVSLVTQQTDAAFDYTSPLIKRVLVLAHFVDTGQTAGSTQHNNVTAVNAAHKARYGDLFLDVAAYLASPQLWVDTGLTPTPTDLQQQADGIKPSSVSHDNAHLNDAGYTAVSALIRNRLAFLGWY